MIFAFSVTFLPNIIKIRGTPNKLLDYALSVLVESYLSAYSTVLCCYLSLLSLVLNIDCPHFPSSVFKMLFDCSAAFLQPCSVHCSARF